MTWLVAALITVALLIGGGYETWAVQKKGRMTITLWTAKHPHAAIIGFSLAGMVFGYILGVGGP